MNFSWDYCEGTETVIRKMVLGNMNDLKQLLNEHDKKELKKIFLNNIHRFHGKDRSFWKVLLEVSDEEVERKSNESFRKAPAIRYFP